MDFPSSFNAVGISCIYEIPSLKRIIFRNTNPPTIQSNTFLGMRKSCKIYVPDANVNDYKTATNWTTFTNYIYPLSTYPN